MNRFFYKGVMENILKEKDDEAEIIVGGDFNTILDLDKDKFGGANQMSHPNSNMTIKHMIEHLQLVDVWRFQNNDTQQFTWSKDKPKLVMVRLDYFLISRSLIKYVTKSDILPKYLSDHDSPYFIIKFSQVKRGPGYWKLNVSLLEYNDYTDDTRNIIMQKKKEAFKNVMYKWENGGQRILHSICIMQEKK